MAERLSAVDWPSLLRPGSRVFVPGGPSEPTVLLDALAARAQAAAGVTFCGAFMPGINRRDLALLTDTTESEIHFVYLDLFGGVEAGRAHFFPLGYRAVWDRFRHGPPIDIAILHLSPAGANGRHSLGVNADFAEAALHNAKTVIGLINPAMPAPPDSPTIDPAMLAHVIEHEAPLLNDPGGAPGADTLAVAARIAQLVNDGDTLEFGLGQMQAAVLGTLTNHKALKIHTGMVSDPVLGLIEAGALSADPATILTGFALGSQALYDRAAHDPLFAFRPVNVTHEFGILRRIRNFVGINSVLEVDLFGQANAEFLNGRQISGQGGLGDFIRGARAAEGGRGIVAFPSTAKGGALSRIVPRLTTPPTLSRYETDWVVTEHGAVSLKGLDVEARARALIGLAAPAHREALERAWKETHP